MRDKQGTPKLTPETQRTVDRVFEKLVLYANSNGLDISEVANDFINKYIESRK